MFRLCRTRADRRQSPVGYATSLVDPHPKPLQRYADLLPFLRKTFHVGEASILFFLPGVRADTAAGLPDRARYFFSPSVVSCFRFCGMNTALTVKEREKE